jgi:hypothetical protein
MGKEKVKNKKKNEKMYFFLKSSFLFFSFEIFSNGNIFHEINDLSKKENLLFF